MSDETPSAVDQADQAASMGADDQTASAEKADLARAEALYEAGDFRAVNQLAGGLAERAKDPEVKEHARTLASRVQIDPFVLWVWAGTTLLVFGIVYAFVLR